VKLSIIVLCWNDLKVITDCLNSVFNETSQIDFEVIVSDNGSTDGSVEFIREHFPKVRIVENRANFGFAKGNNAGIRIAQGEYMLILNPDTIIRDRAFEKMVAFADKHPEAGAFGCRLLNPDGSFQTSAQPIPTVGGWLLGALCLRWLNRISPRISSDVYLGWDGRTEREIGFQVGCCVMFRSDLLKRLGGFDEQFFYHFEESDLCARVWKSGFSVLYYPHAEVVHLGGQSVGRFPIRFALETYRSGYRFFYKYYGRDGVIGIRRVYLLGLYIRLIGCSLRNLVKSNESMRNRLAMYRVAIKWNRLIDPKRFVETGQEPNVGYEPLAPAPKCIESAVLPGVGRL
jgi:GT2 family glycosyltransferase